MSKGAQVVYDKRESEIYKKTKENAELLILNILIT